MGGAYLPSAPSWWRCSPCTFARISVSPYSALSWRFWSPLSRRDTQTEEQRVSSDRDTDSAETLPWLICSEFSVFPISPIQPFLYWKTKSLEHMQGINSHNAPEQHWAAKTGRLKKSVLSIKDTNTIHKTGNQLQGMFCSREQDSDVRSRPKLNDYTVHRGEKHSLHRLPQPNPRKTSQENLRDHMRRGLDDIRIHILQSFDLTSVTLSNSLLNPSYIIQPRRCDLLRHTLRFLACTAPDLLCNCIIWSPSALQLNSTRGQSRQYIVGSRRTQRSRRPWMRTEPTHTGRERDIRRCEVPWLPWLHTAVQFWAV